MKFTFHKTLFKLGKMRFGIGYTSKNNAIAWLLMLFMAIPYLIWYMLIGTLWLCYISFIPVFYVLKYSFIGIYQFSRWCIIKPFIWFAKKVKKVVLSFTKRFERFK